MIQSKISPLRLIIIGFVLVFVGFAIPFAVVIKLIENTFFLSFFAYGAQVSGLILGIIGAANWTSIKRANRDDDSDW